MHYFIPLAYDRIDPTKGTGKGTAARCIVLLKKALDVVQKEGIHSKCIFVATAGFSKENPGKPTREVQVSLTQDIMRFIQTSWSGRKIGRPIAWGTYQEVLTALEIICDEETYRVKNQVLTPEPTDHKWPDVHISTNLGHMPRVRLCCFFFRRRLQATHIRRAKFHFVVAPHSFTLKEWGQETIKFFIYLYRFVFKKW